MTYIWDEKPFSINDLACDEAGDPIKTEMGVWLEKLKDEYDELRGNSYVYFCILNEIMAYLHGPNQHYMRTNHRDALLKILEQFQSSERSAK